MHIVAIILPTKGSPQTLSSTTPLPPGSTCPKPYIKDDQLQFHVLEFLALHFLVYSV